MQTPTMTNKNPKFTRRLRLISDEDDVRDYIMVAAEANGWHVSHVESHVTSPGIPDLNLGKDNKDLWIEVKIWRRGIHMRPPQRKWHRDRAAAGGKSFVVSYIDGYLYPVSGVVAAFLTPKHINWKGNEKYGLEDVAVLLDRLSAL